MTTTDKTKIFEADEVNDEYSKIKFIGYFSIVYRTSLHSVQKTESIQEIVFKFEMTINKN